MSLPIKAFLYAVRFLTASPTIRVRFDGADQTLTLAVSTDTDYFVSGDGAADDLVTILQTALRTHTGTGHGTIACAISATNVLTITSPTALSILGAHAGTTVDLGVFGLPTGATLGGGTSLVGTYSTRGYWSPDKPHLRDFGDQPVLHGSVVAASGGSSRGSIRDTGKKERQITYQRVARARTMLVFAAVQQDALEYAWGPSGGLMCADAFRVYDDRTSRTTYTRYRSKDAGRPWAEDEAVSFTAYSVTFDLLRVT